MLSFSVIRIVVSETHPTTQRSIAAISNFLVAGTTVITRWDNLVSLTLEVTGPKLELLPATPVYEDVVICASRASNFIVVIVEAILVEAICTCWVA